MKAKIYNLEDTIDFGKLHKGKTVAKVLEVNPTWLLWADGNVAWFTLHEDVWILGRLPHYCRLERAGRNVLWGERPY